MSTTSKPASAPGQARKPVIYHNHAFICYTHKDKDTANEIYTFLNRQGLSAYFADTKIHPGDWENQVKRAIATSDVFLVIVSENILGNPNMRKEIETAAELDKPFFLIGVDDQGLRAGTCLSYQIRTEAGECIDKTLGDSACIRHREKGWKKMLLKQIRNSSPHYHKETLWQKINLQYKYWIKHSNIPTTNAPFQLVLLLPEEFTQEKYQSIKAKIDKQCESPENDISVTAWCIDTNDPPEELVKHIDFCNSLIVLESNDPKYVPYYEEIMRWATCRENQTKPVIRFLQGKSRPDSPLAQFMSTKSLSNILPLMRIAAKRGHTVCHIQSFTLKICFVLTCFFFLLCLLYHLSTRPETTYAPTLNGMNGNANYAARYLRKITNMEGVSLAFVEQTDTIFSSAHSGYQPEIGKGIDLSVKTPSIIGAAMQHPNFFICWQRKSQSDSSGYLRDAWYLNHGKYLQEYSCNKKLLKNNMVKTEYSDNNEDGKEFKVEFSREGDYPAKNKRMILTFALADPGRSGIVIGASLEYSHSSDTIPKKIEEVFLSPRTRMILETALRSLLQTRPATIEHSDLRKQAISATVTAYKKNLINRFAKYHAKTDSIHISFWKAKWYPDGKEEVLRYHAFWNNQKNEEKEFGAASIIGTAFSNPQYFIPWMSRHAPRHIYSFKENKIDTVKNSRIIDKTDSTYTVKNYYYGTSFTVKFDNHSETKKYGILSYCEKIGNRSYGVNLDVHAFTGHDKIFDEIITDPQSLSELRDLLLTAALLEDGSID